MSALRWPMNSLARDIVMRRILLNLIRYWLCWVSSCPSYLKIVSSDWMKLISFVKLTYASLCLIMTSISLVTSVLRYSLMPSGSSNSLKNRWNSVAGSSPLKNW